jgi:hypothetical protein
MLEHQRKEIEDFKQKLWEWWTKDMRTYEVEKDPVTGEYVRKKNNSPEEITRMRLLRK